MGLTRGDFHVVAHSADNCCQIAVEKQQDHAAAMVPAWCNGKDEMMLGGCCDCVCGKVARFHMGWVGIGVGRVGKQVMWGVPESESMF